MSGEANTVMPGPAPSAGRSRLRAAWSLATFSTVQLLRQQRIFLVLLLLSVPLVVAIVLRTMGQLHNMDDFFWQMTLFAFQMTIAPLLVMLLFTSLISGDASDGTIAYLFMRRLSRPGVLMAKFAGTLFAVLLLATLAHMAFFAVTYTAAHSVSPDWVGLWMTLIANSLAITVFACIFTAIGLIAKKPMGIGALYVLVVEILLANQRLNVQRFSVLYYVRSLLWNFGRVQGRLVEARGPTEMVSTPMRQRLEDVLLVDEIVSMPMALIVLGATALAALILSLAIVRYKEFTRVEAGQA